MIRDLIDAINSRKEIEFTYSGYVRKAKPVAVGVSRKDNLITHD